MTEKFIIGLIGAPFGVKGFVKVKPLSGEIAHLLKLQSVTVSKDGKERELKIEENAPVCLKQHAPPCVHIRFADIDSPEAAKTLNGAQLIAGREQAAPLKDGEFYIEDLKGLEVIALIVEPSAIAELSSCEPAAIAETSAIGELSSCEQAAIVEPSAPPSPQSPVPSPYSPVPTPHSPVPSPHKTIGHITDIIEGGGGELAEIKLTNGEKRLVPFRKEFFSVISPKENRAVLQNLWILE